MISKKYLHFSVFALLMALGACTAQFEQGEVVLNFCDADSTDYIDCTEFGLTPDTITMELETTASDVTSIDSVVFELPEAGVYCSTDADNISTADAEVYDVEVSCIDLADYEDQNTQLSFTVTMTLSDGSTVTETGVAEDWV